MLFRFRTESSFQREKTITGKKYNFILRSKKISQKNDGNFISDFSFYRF
jgi:hypothetical protein